ncbi:MAG: copper transporter, partial [Actinomycetota bacterium]|nr:copper transporter [Actinomycetota bacterium]
MINLRYHIVSVVAVFLALGIGLALGSTFVDSILVNELEDQVNQLDLAQEEAAEQKDQAIADRDEEVQNNEALRAEMSA